MGKLICLEGLDSSGKSSQVKLIGSYLQEKGLSVDHLHFPMYGHNTFSDMISRFLRGEFGNIDEVDPYYVATMYAMDRYKFVPELEIRLASNDVVVLDRYVYSNVAFQGAKLNDGSSKTKIMEWILEFEFDFLGLPFPDLNLFLDVPMSVISQRLQGERTGDDRNYLQGKKDVHEQDLDFQRRVRDVYLLLHEQEENFHKIETCLIDSNNELVIFNEKYLFSTYRFLIDDVIHKI